MSSQQQQQQQPVDNAAAAGGTTVVRGGSTSGAAATAAASTGGSSSSSNGSRLPESKTMEHASKLAIVEDKPIMMDYWTFSLSKTAFIGVKANNEKLLVKSLEEYTSPIVKIYKAGGREYIIVTENSIYIVDMEIPNKKIAQ